MTWKYEISTDPGPLNTFLVGLKNSFKYVCTVYKIRVFVCTFALNLAILYGFSLNLIQNSPFCNSLDKFVGLMNPITFAVPQYRGGAPLEFRCFGV